MTDTLTIQQDQKEFFEAACKQYKVELSIESETPTETNYRLVFRFPAELYYIGREMQMDVSKRIVERALSKH